MCGTFGDIFDRIHANKDSIRRVEKTLRKQRKQNNSLAAFILACMAYMTVIEIQQIKQSIAFAALRAEIEELKTMKGE